jgi:hypothetical protein
LQYVVTAPCPLIVLISEAIKIASVRFSRKNLLRGFVACSPCTMTKTSVADHEYLPSKLEGNFLSQLQLVKDTCCTSAILSSDPKRLSSVSGPSDIE